MPPLKFEFEYEDQEYKANAIKMKDNGRLIPVKFHIYGFVPAFKMFKGPVILTANRDGQVRTFARYGTVDHFKSTAITALYKHCQDNDINMF